MKAGEEGQKLGGCEGQGIAPYMLKAGVLVFLAIMLESRYRSLIKGWAPGARRAESPSSTEPESVTLNNIQWIGSRKMKVDRVNMDPQTTTEVC